MKQTGARTDNRTPPDTLSKARRTAWLTFLCAALFLLSGCSDMVLLNPKGPIGETERFVILAAFALMLIVVIPVFIMLAWIPWHYRASNTKAPYTPKWNFSLKIELVVWLVPAAIVTCLGILIWHTTYGLDPYKPLDSEKDHVTVEAVSLDWKWLFIYPEHNIAVVNELVFPANVPIRFKLTSDSVMTSFFIPQLGSQLYAMAGMETRLHLMANEPGTYLGQNQQYSGKGYSDMRFEAIAVGEGEFEDWVEKTRNSPDHLDLNRYENLQRPSDGYYPITYFASVHPELFDYIIGKYMHSHNNDHGAMNSHASHAGMAPGGSKEH